MFRRSAVATAVATVLAVAYLFTIGPSAAAQQDLNCGDLTYEQAQAELQRDPTDPHGLDADNDGEACEDSPRTGGASGTGADGGTASGAGGDTDTGRPATGGVATGAGGMASQDSGSSSWGWLALVGAAAVGAGFFRLRRAR